ncbi:uncharacterized protein O3C94_009968 [Discoglossus pictus]
MVHPTVPDSALFFPTIHERPMSFSPPPTCPSPKVSAAQRRKSTSFLESQGRPVQCQMRTFGQSPLLSGGDLHNWRTDGQSAPLPAANEAAHRHPSYEVPMFADGRPGTATPNEAHMRPADTVYLASIPYNTQADVVSMPPRPGLMDEQKLAQLSSVYDFQTGQTYITQPLQSLRLEPGANQSSSLGSISAPATGDPHILFHQVFVPQSAPAILTQGSEGHPGCVFEFHVHASSATPSEGAFFLPHRIYRTRRGSMEFNQDELPHSPLVQSRLQTVTEEQYNHIGAEPKTPLVGVFEFSQPKGSPEYSSDSSQRNSSDPGDYMSPPPPTGLGTDQSLTHTQTMFRDPQVFFCFPQTATGPYLGSATVYNQQVIKEEFKFFSS